MNKNQKWRRVLSLLFAMVMLVSIMVVGSVVASADEEPVNISETDVAKIGNQGYATLQAAINAANAGDTVTLLKDVSYATVTTINKPIVLDGNGKTLKSTGTRGIKVDVAGDVEIKNLTVIQNAGMNSADVRYCVYVTNQASSLKLTNCNLHTCWGTGNKDSYIAGVYTDVANAVITLEQCDIQTIYGVYISAKATVNMNTSTISQTMYGFWINASAEIDVNGSTIITKTAEGHTTNNINVAFLIAADNVVVDCDENTKLYVYPPQTPSGTKVSSSTVVYFNRTADMEDISQVDIGSAEIDMGKKNDGTDNLMPLIYLPRAEAQIVDTETGVPVMYPTLDDAIKALESGDKLAGLNGTTIDDTYVNNKLAELGKNFEISEDGTVSVKGVASVTDANGNVVGYYPTLQAAIDAAQSGDTVKLVSDIQLECNSDDDLLWIGGEEYPVLVLINKNLTLDLNGYKLSAENKVTWLDSMIGVEEGCNLVIVDTSDEKTGTVELDEADYALICAYGSNSYIDTTITINSGNYKLTTVSNSGALVLVFMDSTLTVNGGNFELGNANSVNGPLIFKESSGLPLQNITVNGGVFNSDVTANSEVKLGDGYCLKAADGVWTVVDHHTPGEKKVENKVEGNCVTPTTYDEVVYCTVCNAEVSRKSVSEEGTGHNYVAGTPVAPTFDDEGYTVYTCSRCGDSYNGDIKPVKVVVATINGERYESLAAALAEAEDGDIIVLQADCEENITYENRGNITISGGATVTAQPDNNRGAYIEGGYKFTGKITISGSGTLTFTKMTVIAPAGKNESSVYIDTATAPDIVFDNCVLGCVSMNFTAIVYVPGTVNDTEVVFRNCSANALSYLFTTNQGGVESITVENTIATAMASLLKSVKCTNVTVKNVTCDATTIFQVKNSLATTLALENVDFKVTGNYPVVLMNAPDTGVGELYTITLKGENSFINKNGVEFTYDDFVRTQDPTRCPYEIKNLNNVAIIGTTEYSSLQEAINAAKDGDTIKLLANINKDVVVGVNLTLDLNGFEYTGKITFNKSTVIITAPEGLNVYFGEEVAVYAEGKYLAYVKWVQQQLYNGNSVTLDRDIVIKDYDLVFAPKLTSNSNGKYGITAGEGAIFYIIKGDVVLDLNGYSIIWDAHSDYYCDGPFVTLFRVSVEGSKKKDGTVEPCSFTVKDSVGTGAVTIYGAPASLYSTFIYATATIEGGTWTNYPCKECNDYGYFIYPSHGSTMYIKGGEFQQVTPDGAVNQLLGWQGSTVAGQQNYLCNYSKTELVITGGTFIGFDPSQTIFINRGEGKIDKIDGCADGFLPTLNSDGSYGVQAIETYAAVVNGYGYTTLQAAINAAQSGATVTLLKDVEYSANLLVDSGKTITLDLNGKTVKLVQVKSGKGNKVSFNVAGTLTLVDSVGGGKIEQVALDVDTAAITLANGNLIIKSGSVISNSKAIQLGGTDAVNTLVINGGYIEGAKVAVNVNKGTNTVTINGGKLVGEDVMHVASENTVTVSIEITGGEFDGVFYDIPSADVFDLADGYCLKKLANAEHNVYTVGTHKFVAGEVVKPTVNAQGYTVYTCAHCGETEKRDPVAPLGYAAEVNEVKYGTLKDAIAQANAGDTITLLKDITDTVTINKNNLTIEGDGFKFTGAIVVGAAKITVNNVKFVNGTITRVDKSTATVNYTITNCSFEGVADGYSYAIIVGGSSTSVVINNCTANNVGLLYVASSCTTITVTDVTVTNCDGWAFHLVPAATYYFENVKIYGSDCGIVVQNYSEDRTVTLKNCVIDTPKPLFIWAKENKMVNFKLLGTNNFGTNDPVWETIKVNGSYDYATESGSACANLILGEVGATLKAGACETVSEFSLDYYVVYNEGVYSLAKALKFASSNLLLTDTIGIYFNVDPSTLEEGKKYVVEIRPAGAAANSDPIAIIELDGCKALYNGLAAKQMADEFTATIVCVGDESIVCRSVTESVKGYAQRGWNKFDANTIKLLTAMLNYGAEAQIAFVYNTTNLANSFLTVQKDENVADDTTVEATTGETTEETNKAPVNEFYYYGASLNLESNIIFNFKFFADGLTPSSAKVTYKDANGKEVVLDTAASNFKGGVTITTEKNNNQIELIVVKVDKLLIQDAAAELTCTLTFEDKDKDGKNVVRTATDSVIYYCERAINGLNAYEKTDYEAYKKMTFKQKFYRTLMKYVEIVSKYEANYMASLEENNA